MKSRGQPPKPASTSRRPQMNWRPRGKERVEAEQLAYNAVRRKYELGNSPVIDLYTPSAKLATAIANLEGKRIQKIISGITLSYYLGAKLIKE